MYDLIIVFFKNKILKINKKLVVVRCMMYDMWYNVVIYKRILLLTLKTSYEEQQSIMQQAINQIIKILVNSNK